MKSKTKTLLESIQTELNENLNEASKDASMRDLANSLGITGIYTSSEHERDDRDELHGLEGLSFTRKLNEPGHDYYGYAKIITNNLGEFIVSFNMNKRKKEIPLDGFPWKFLQDDAEYQLTDEQKNFIKNNEKELYSLITYVDYHGSEFLEDNKVEETDNCLKEDAERDPQDIDLETDVNMINQDLIDLYDKLATHKGQEIVIRLQDAVTDIMNDMAIDTSSWDIG